MYFHCELLPVSRTTEYRFRRVFVKKEITLFSYDLLYFCFCEYALPLWRMLLLHIYKFNKYLMLYISIVVNTFLISFKMIICICSNAISEANFREFKVILNLNILGGGGL